jgi:anti-sigma factor RsiW
MDERTEQLINRRLDGEITEEESLDLDKRLIRSPEARTYLEEQVRIDSLAGEALRGVVAPGDSQWYPQEESTSWPTRGGIWRRYLRPVAAVAAVIAVAALVASLPSGHSRQPGATSAVVDSGQDAASQAGHQPIQTVPVDDSWPGLPRAGRHEVIGVYDDATQSLYLLEMSPRSGTNSPAAMDF